jgi:hypothetical protein
MEDTETKSYRFRSHEIRRELIFSVMLLLLYPVPIMWVCFILIREIGGATAAPFLVFTLLIELLSAVERTLLIRGMERTTVQLTREGIAKSVGERTEVLPYRRIRRIRVNRSLFRGRVASVLIQADDGERMYLPGFEDLGEALSKLRELLPPDTVQSALAGRIAFDGAFLLFLGGVLAALGAGVIPPLPAMLLVGFSAGAVILRFPYHLILGRSYLTVDRVLVGSYVAAGLLVGAIAGVHFVDRLLTYRAVLSEVEGASGPQRSRAIYALGEVGGEKALSKLLELMRSPEPGQRADAVLALSRTGDGRALGKLREALDDPDPVVRRYAAYGIGCWRRIRDVPLLIRVLERRSEPVEVLAAVNASLERITGRTSDCALDDGPGGVDDHQRRLLARDWREKWRDFLRQDRSGE